MLFRPIAIINWWWMMLLVDFGSEALTITLPRELAEHLKNGKFIEWGRSEANDFATPPFESKIII